MPRNQWKISKERGSEIAINISFDILKDKDLPIKQYVDQLNEKTSTYNISKNKRNISQFLKHFYGGITGFINSCDNLHIVQKNNKNYVKYYNILDDWTIINDDF